jgi:hypothetical protein
MLMFLKFFKKGDENCGTEGLKSSTALDQGLRQTQNDG